MSKKIKLEKETDEYADIQRNPFREAAANILDLLEDYLAAIGIKPSKKALEDTEIAAIIYGEKYYSYEDDFTDSLYSLIYSKIKDAKTIEQYMFSHEMAPLILYYARINKVTISLEDAHEKLQKDTLNIIKSLLFLNKRWGI
jgi:hypothetical protein